jgi:5'-3' exonuclease
MSKVLLADGMSVLVRASRAALRAQAMSYHGVTTGPLVMFAGTMAAHLAAEPWTHVVIAWEGVPELNWRRAFYYGYKPYRPLFRADNDQMSQDEELAREFCGAAGLLQDWAPAHEGDDIIAAWWRQFRHQLPDAEIHILTSDKDLYQLCDDRTLVRGWAGDDGGRIITQNEVFDAYGVMPEFLPLLRALAGDPADGIPGLKGVGLRKAQALAGAGGSKLVAIWKLAEVLGVDQVVAAFIWYAVSELRDPLVRPDLHSSGTSCELAEWSPGEHAAGLGGFLAKYGMARMAARQAAGKLPWPPIPDKEPI